MGLWAWKSSISHDGSRIKTLHYLERMQESTFRRAGMYGWVRRVQTPCNKGCRIASPSPPLHPQQQICYCLHLIELPTPPSTVAKVCLAAAAAAAATKTMSTTATTETTPAATTARTRTRTSSSQPSCCRRVLRHRHHQCVSCIIVAVWP